MRRIEKTLVVLGLLSLVVIALPFLGVFAAITVIGLPLALAYWAIPAVFLVALTAYLIHLVLPFPGKTRIIASIVLALAVLAVPPYVLNGPAHRKAASLAANDIDTLRLPITARSIGSRENFRFAKGTTQCDGFCLHALLSGTAERFLVAKTDQLDVGVSAHDEAVEFRLERRDACPAVNFKPGAHALTFRITEGDNDRAADPVETLKLRISNGECLVSRPATLGEADIVVTRGTITDRANRHRTTGFDLKGDTVVAKRMSVHQKASGNRFNEVYRRTEVRYRPFGWLLLPSITMRGDFNIRIGWWRRESQINVQSRYHDPAEWTNFLSGKLALALRLKGDDTRKKTLDKLRKLLSEETPPQKADWELFSQYFDRIGLGRNTNMSAEDFELGLRMLENRDYPVPPRLHNLVNYAKRHGGESDIARLAGVLVSRMSDDAERYGALGAKPREQIKRLALGVRTLPNSALLPHRDALISLASRSDVQRDGYAALQRLAVYGDDAVPTLLALMKAGLEGGEHFYRDNRFQHPYLGGLQGLCMAGAKAPSARPELRRLTDAGNLPDHGPYGRLLFTTLLRVGEDREHVRALFVAAARNKKNATDRHFNALEARALRDDPRCHF